MLPIAIVLVLAQQPISGEPLTRTTQNAVRECVCPGVIVMPMVDAAGGWLPVGATVSVPLSSKIALDLDALTTRTRTRLHAR